MPSFRNRVACVACLAGFASINLGFQPAEADTPASHAPVAGSKFETLDDGSIWHPASKGRCPDELAGFIYKEPTLFEQDGTDVSCTYEGDGGTSYLTIYFFQTDLFDTPALAAEHGAAAILNRFDEAEYLAEASLSCSHMIDLMNGIETTLHSNLENDVEIVLGQTPCLVFRISYGATLLATDMIGPWHLKVRITAQITGEDVEPLVQRATDVMTLQHAWMSGRPVPARLALPPWE